jgi:hypothetical protein
MNKKNKQLQQAINCSEMMLQDAKAGEWQKVIAAEKQRHELLDALFATPSGKQDVDDIDHKINQILNINKKIEMITANTRKKIHNDTHSISKGRQAVNVYAQNAG